MINLLGKPQDKANLSSFSDPFSKKGVKRVSMEIRASAFTFSRSPATATIWLQNGKTSANHDIEADDFQSLCIKVQEFINSLPE